MDMPKAPMDENCFLSRAEDNVGAAGQPANILFEPESSGMQLGAQLTFRSRL
jgi:hypothetical protein